MKALGFIRKLTFKAEKNEDFVEVEHIKQYLAFTVGVTVAQNLFICLY